MLSADPQVGLGGLKIEYGKIEDINMYYPQYFMDLVTKAYRDVNKDIMDIF